MHVVKKAKDLVDLDFAKLVAADLSTTIRLVYESSIDPRTIITAPSPRHSAYIGVDHFAGLVARLVAQDLGLQYVLAFEPIQTDARGHHPKMGRAKGHMQRVIRMIPGAIPAGSRVILIDDIATSGQAIEDHVSEIRATGSTVSSIVWLYGETRGFGRNQ